MKNHLFSLPASVRHKEAAVPGPAFKRLLSGLLALSVLLCAAGAAFAENAGELTDGEKAAMDHLALQLDEAAARLVAVRGEMGDCYSELPALSGTDTDSFPEKFDLRDRGVVTGVKQQAPWGTCWTFGTIAACETSLLSMMGLTAEGYREKYGVEMDLSELHLAWFTAMPLPEVSVFPEGEYPYDASQAGEGARRPEGKAPLRMGGTYLLSASSLAAGIGVAAESIAPYESIQGTLDPYDDWAVPEQYRFTQSFELTNTNVLPSPGWADADGNYVYRPEGTAAIKRELLAGRGVAAAYWADNAKPEPSREELRAQYEANLIGEDLSDEDKQAIVGIQLKELDPLTLPDDQLLRIIRYRCEIWAVEDGFYDLPSLSHEDLALLAGTEQIGWTLEDIRLDAASQTDNRIMFFIGEDPMIWAQYCHVKVQPNHAAYIVGWDDAFPASAFPEGHQPPADGVWICRNSYGETWGMDGYFCLSYYDRSLSTPQTFEFAPYAEDQPLSWHYDVLQYDYMPAEMISSTLFGGPVYAANVFSVGGDEVLRHVSAMTGDLNTQVTVSVWLLKKGASSPTDGKLLSTVTETFPYAGYHRITLPESLLLPRGSRIGITVLQRVPSGDTVKYALVNTSSQGENAPLIKAQNERPDPAEPGYIRWFAGVINPGESYVSFEEGRWLDWREAVDRFASKGSCAFLAYDNLPVKGYLYPADEILSAHDLDSWVPSSGGSAAICPDCGFVLERVD